MDLIFMEFLYIFYILGSFSAGYAVIRAGFPSFQEASNFTKLLWGYILGALIFIFAAGLVYFSGFNEKHFFFASAFIFMLVFIAFFTNRVLNKEKDIEYSTIKEIKKTEIPLMGKLPEEGGEYFGKKSIGFEHGLMIKKRTKQFASPEEINKQLSNKQFFKPKDNTVLEAIKSKTKVLEKKEALAQKKAALERLKLSAKQINKGKTNIKRAEEMEEIEEELLGDIGNEEP